MIDLNKYNVDFLQGITIDKLTQVNCKPTTKQGVVRDIYNTMEHGDSVLICNWNNAMSVRSQMGRICNELNDGFRITFRTVEGGYRIFKVKK